MRTTRFVISVVVVVSLIGCVQQPRVGVLRPLTGHSQAYGHAVDRGIQLAVSDAAERALLPPGFETLGVDTGSDPSRAVSGFRSLVEESGVRLILGGVTADEASALVPVLDKARVVCLSPSAPVSDLSRRCPYLYRMYPGDGIEGRTAARHLYENLGVRRLLVYSDDSALTREVEARFRKHFQLTLQGTIGTTVHLGVEHWRKLSVDALHIHQPDAVYIVGHADRILDVLRHLEGQSFDGVKCTTSTVYVGDVLQRAGVAAEGVTFPLPVYDVASSAEPMQSFVERYRESFGGSPDIFAAHGYDAMQVAIHALATARSLYTPDITKSLHFNLHDFAGVTGAIAFDEHGDVRRYPVMHCVSAGEVVSCRRPELERLEQARQMLREIERSRHEGERRGGGVST